MVLFYSQTYINLHLFLRAGDTTPLIFQKEMALLGSTGIIGLGILFSSILAYQNRYGYLRDTPAMPGIEIAFIAGLVMVVIGFLGITAVIMIRHVSR